MTSPAIVVLCHHSQHNRLESYIVGLMAREWEGMGLRVLFHYGTESPPPADLLFLHVDLSLVPEAYTALTTRYPVVINGSATDIRKRTQSRNRVLPADRYDGPVIVKSSLNYSGKPERVATGLAWPDRLQYLRQRLGRKFFPSFLPATYRIRDKEDYLIVEHRAAVPQDWFDDEDIVIERFHPERFEGGYVLREWYFLGDRNCLHCEVGNTPVFTSGQTKDDLVVPASETLHRIRREASLDYGKIDYVLDASGEAVLFDLNKTIGLGSPFSPQSRAFSAALASSILSFLP